MQPDRFAIDILLKGHTPVQSTALFADIWTYIGNHSPLHGKSHQRLAFGILHQWGHSSRSRLPRLRIYSTDPEFSAAVAEQLMQIKTIVIGRRPYTIDSLEAVPSLTPEVIDMQTPVMIRQAVSDPTRPEPRKSRCITYEDPFFHHRLDHIMRHKLYASGLTDQELPEGPLLTMVTGRRVTTQIKERNIYLPGTIGRWQLHGSPDVRRCLLLSGFGVKTGMGFGFAVPALR